jgi:hypothetical protein
VQGAEEKESLHPQTIMITLIARSCVPDIVPGIFVAQDIVLKKWQVVRKALGESDISANPLIDDTCLRSIEYIQRLTSSWDLASPVD